MVESSTCEYFMSLLGRERVTTTHHQSPVITYVIKVQKFVR